MNKVILIGRLTQDPTCNYGQNNIAFVRGTIAVQRDFKNQNGEYDTDFINFVAYRQTAELITKHFLKGDRIGLIGNWQTDKYQDQNGQTRISNYLRVNEIEFLQDKKQEQTPTPPPAPTHEEFKVSEDDLPF